MTCDHIDDDLTVSEHQISCICGKQWLAIPKAYQVRPNMGIEGQTLIVHPDDVKLIYASTKQG